MTTKEIKAFGTNSEIEPLQKMKIERRIVTDHDVEIEILFCGICHSDLHQVKNDFGGAMYPIVPGHEIVGRVTAIGNHVTKFKVGDL
ncbi:MAG: alcohol dehydrogenase catalytic domain-containing protein, partial [Saprospiraceae bacterium]